MRRRDLLKAFSVLASTPFASAFPATAPPFDYAALKGRARSLANQPHQPSAGRLPDSLARLDWDRYQAIRFRPEHALWADAASRFRLQFFHLGRAYRTPVRLHEIAGDGGREVAYSSAQFDYGKSGLAHAHLPADLGFAGFRLCYHTDWQRDIAAFLGASYFRAVGAEMQYGLSARGLAVDCGLARAEEFPEFTAFWFERPAPEADRLRFYALLDSPSISGAYRFTVVPGATLVMEVDAALYPRRPIERLGVAPLTSMFQHGENDRRMANDWRPEIHDSDGLALWTGRGEWIWRPLINPPRLRFNAYADQHPRGYGLMQRDRDFDHYQDDGVFYERRPSLWVEPTTDWGRGSVQLVELPTPDETEDNIVAFWHPESLPQPGQELLFGYRLHWGQPPFASPLARVLATRTGIGGIVGQKRDHASWRFVVDFVGGPLAMVGEGSRIEPVIGVSSGRIELPSARPLATVRGYRVMFDLRPEAGSVDPVNLRLFLQTGSQALSETWMYQWTPPPGV